MLKAYAPCSKAPSIAVSRDRAKFTKAQRGMYVPEIRDLGTGMYVVNENCLGRGKRNGPWHLPDRPRPPASSDLPGPRWARKVTASLR